MYLCIFVKQNKKAMNAMIATMSAELIARNINAVGSYETLPAKMAEAVETVKLFGYDVWEKNSCMSSALKEIVKKYADA